MHKPEAGLENETNKILSDFEIQTNYPILSRRVDLLLTSEKFTYYLMDFAISADHRKKRKESKKIKKYLDLTRKLKN